MKPSDQNRDVFSKNVAMFDHDYKRPDEEEAVKFLKPGKLLIGGVGAGRTIGFMHERGFTDMIAVDISPEMVKRCKEKWPQVEVLTMDLQKTTFTDSLFDSIFLPFHTIAYVDDLKTTLLEMRRILKPGGTLLFSVPNFWYVNAVLKGDIFKGRRHSTNIKRAGGDSLSTLFMSMNDTRWLRRIFPYVRARGRVSLQTIPNPNWKDRVLQVVPFIDKSLYFFCKKSEA